MELRQPACGVGKKLQTELAYDGIEATAPERELSPNFGDGLKDQAAT
jgi:hypothetical protein